MSFGSPMSLFSSVVISCLGMGFFLYGKRATKLWPLLGGLALCAYPFFISSVWLMWVIAGGIVAALFLLREK